MEMPISEIADRYSICLLKSERIHDTDISEVNRELNILKNELNKFNNINDYINSLYNINGQIWDLESDIRRGKEKEIGLEEVGRRAIAIRELNKKRIFIKNEIVKKYNMGFTELKMYHASQ
jgi:hypothetical protein